MVPAVVVLGLALAHALGAVAGLEGETVVVTARLGDIGQVH